MASLRLEGHARVVVQRERPTVGDASEERSMWCLECRHWCVDLCPCIDSGHRYEYRRRETTR